MKGNGKLLGFILACERWAYIIVGAGLVVFVFLLASEVL